MMEGERLTATQQHLPTSNSAYWRAVLALACVCLALSYSQGAVTTFYAGKNLDAPLVVLDASSLQAPSAANGALRVNTEQKCALICQGLKGCNAYTYCNKTTGCTGFCNDYVSSNPALSGTGADNYQFATLPIKSFGKFVYPGSPNGCMPTDTNRWPYGLCSLKYQDPALPVKFFAGASTDGWTSGVISSTTPCNGIPFALCDICNSLPAPRNSECLNCAADVYSVGGASNLNKATAGWYCLWCVNPQQNTTTCRQCLKENTLNGLPYLCV